MKFRQAWAEGPFYAFMMDTFPRYRTMHSLFNVDTFRAEPEISKSHEAIYQWFRRGTVSIDNAKAIVKLAGREDNAAALDGRVPKLEDMLQFM